MNERTNESFLEEITGGNGRSARLILEFGGPKYSLGSVFCRKASINS